MATTEGCLDLLTALASLDARVKFDAVTAYGWAQVLSNLPDEILVRAGFDAARANDYGGLVTVGMVEKHAQPYLRQIAADVKSARIRGLVPKDWPDNKPIPKAAQERLTRIFEETNDYPRDIAPAGKPIDLGQIGKEVPE